MAYLPLKPAATDKLSNSQSDIQGNFAQANTSFGIDHFEFDDATGDTGKHKHTLFVDLDSKAPPIVPPVTTADELAVYVKKDASAVPVPALFYRKPTGGQEVQFSGIDIIDGTTGEMPLFGGLQIKWGLLSFIGNSKAFIFDATGSGTSLGLTDFTTAVYSFVATATNSQAIVSTTNVTINGFTMNKSGPSTQQIYWVAIGK